MGHGADYLYAGRVPDSLTSNLVVPLFIKTTKKLSLRKITLEDKSSSPLLDTGYKFF